MSILIKNIHKRFGTFKALNNVSLEIKSEELIALLGPSGSGKTTLLRIIAGLDFADEGAILMEGKETRYQPIRDRNVGFMFQHYTLFKHMSVFENIAFGLRVMKKPERPREKEINAKVLNLLKLVHLEGLQSRYPHQLSGGQRQRVALARALAVQPRVLLLDEPFGALDAKVRKELRRFLRRLHEEIQVTTIFVTHDQEEAMEVADRVVIMNNGEVEQMGTPEHVWNNPCSSFVYDFLGNYNEFSGWKNEDGSIRLADSKRSPENPVKPSSPPQTAWQKQYPRFYKWFRVFFPASREERERNVPSIKKKTSPSFTEQKKVKLFARPHDMLVSRVLLEGEYITAKIVHINPAGPLVKMEVEPDSGNLLQVDLTSTVFKTLNLQKGDTIFLYPNELKVFE